MWWQAYLRQKGIEAKKREDGKVDPKEEENIYKDKRLDLLLTKVIWEPPLDADTEYFELLPKGQLPVHVDLQSQLNDENNISSQSRNQFEQGQNHPQSDSSNHKKINESKKMEDESKCGSTNPLSSKCGSQSSDSDISYQPQKQNTSKKNKRKPKKRLDKNLYAQLSVAAKNSFKILNTQLNIQNFEILQKQFVGKNLLKLLADAKLKQYWLQIFQRRLMQKYLKQTNTKICYKLNNLRQLRVRKQYFLRSFTISPSKF